MVGFADNYLQRRDANLAAARQLVADYLAAQSRTTTNAEKTTLTGVELDDDFANQIIGKDIPIFVGGRALIGCRICEGPFLTTVDDAGFVDIIVTPALAATPTATRTLTQIRLNGVASFTSVDGGATWTAVDATPGPSVFAGVEITIRTGTETQLPFDSSVTRYGARAVPYRSHILIELKNIPLSLFNNEIPFVSVIVYEEDYLSRISAIRKLADYARYDSDEYDINVSGQDIFWVVHRQTTFIEYLQELQRSVGRTWNIVINDKLRVFETLSTDTPITITRADIVAGSAEFSKTDPREVPAIRNLGFIDTGRDNDFNSVKAVRARFPIALTASEEAQDLEIPIGMAASEAKAIANRSLLIDDIARDTFSCKLMPHMRGIEPGDIIQPNFGAGYKCKVISRTRNFDWTCDIVAERVDLARFVIPPQITSNGGGASANISVDEEDGVGVTTVTATNADEGSFEIIGGADAALFTIDPDTGVLEFLTEPDYDDPADSDLNNTYQVVVQVTGSNLTDTQTITVTVNDVADGSEEAPEFLILF